MFFWTMLAILYLVLFVTLGIVTFRKGHHLLFWLGIIFPILWIIGAIKAPTAQATSAA